jgi:hypothetical protein
MKAMLEARIVAIRIHGPLHGFISPGAVLVASSSRGDLMGIIMRRPILASRPGAARYHSQLR